MSYDSTVTFAALATRIREAGTVVCTSHEKPDGDAMGCVIAMVRALGGITNVHGWLLGSVPPPIGGLAEDTAWTRIHGAGDIPDLEPDLILVMDTGAWSQLELLEPWLRTRSDRVIGLDHHASGDDVAPMRVVDASAASCTMLALRLLDELGIDLTQSIATPLFAGLATDTGWFRQANADAAAFAVAARLLAAGVDKDGLFRTIEETARPARLALQARALSSVQWAHEGRVAVMQLTQRDFEDTDGRRSDVTGMVNMPLVVRGGEMAALLIEERDGGVKASLRSKPPSGPGGEFIDVRGVARLRGGGGHVHAAGVRLDMPLAAARKALLTAVEESGA